MLRRKYEPGEDPPDVDSHINALLEQARREQVHRQTANLSRAAVKRTTVVLTFRENVRLSVQQKCHLSIPGWCQMVGLPELPGIAASAGFLHRCISSPCLCAQLPGHPSNGRALELDPLHCLPALVLQECRLPW